MGSTDSLYISKSDNNLHQFRCTSENVSKIHKGRKYYLYSEEQIKISWKAKILEIFQLVGLTFLIPLTLGTILISRDFRNALNCRLQAIKTTVVLLYFPEEMNENASFNSAHEESSQGMRCAIKEAYKLLEEIKLEDAFNSIDGLTDEFERDLFVMNLATIYFKQHLIDKVLTVLEKIKNFEKKNKLHEEFAFSCCLLGKYEEAKKFIKAISDEDDDELLKKIFRLAAEELYSHEKLEETIKILEYLNYPEDFYLRIANYFIEKNRLDEAVKVVNKIFFKTKDKYDLFALLAEKYFETNELEKAVKYAPYYSEPIDIKNLFLRIANKYHEEGNQTKALEILGRIIDHGVLIHSNSEPIAKEFLKNEDFDNAFKVIRESEMKE